jgi:transitional endoplasmic reticulum ATPase
MRPVRQVGRPRQVGVSRWGDGGASRAAGVCPWPGREDVMALPSLAGWSSHGLSHAKPTVRLGDVVGMPEVAARLRREVVDRVPTREARETLSTWVRVGALLFGPPGCGWRWWAGAVAAELGMELVTMRHDERVGSSPVDRALVRQAFAAARERSPSVLLLPGLAALGRGPASASGTRERPGAVAELVAQIDRVSDAAHGVVVIGATSRPWDVDPALLNPEQLGHGVFVPPPDAAARRVVLVGRLAGRPTGDCLDLGPVVAATGGYACADLVRLVDLAAETALAELLDRGGEPRITQRHLVAAATAIRASPPGWFRRARTYANYADPAGLLDDALAWCANAAGGTR